MGVRNMVRCGLCAGLLCLCAWVCIPAGGMVFTLQSLGVFLTLGLLGGKWGCLAIGVYLLCGGIGLPVFSGFRGGLSVLLGATGGYLWGFFAAGLCWWLTQALWKKPWVSLVAGQLMCYLCGTLWYCTVYAPGSGFFPCLSLCVLPYVLPDGLKLWLARALTRRLKPVL